MPRSSSQNDSRIANGRKRVAIAIREPWHLPEEVIELPSPGMMPAPPPPPNYLIMVLPPVIMIMGSLFVALLSGASQLKVMLPMVIMSLGFPLANIINLRSQQKQYRLALVQREQDYRRTLQAEKQRVDGLVAQQRQILEKEYPRLEEVTRIALARGKNPRLWWRRPYDNDFLFCRLGTGDGAPSIKIQPPRYFDPNDPLSRAPQGLIQSFGTAAEMAQTVDLKTVGSLVITNGSSSQVYGFARRLLLDLVVHHSPDTLRLALVAEGAEAVSRWPWMKWFPHTLALYQRADAQPYLCFTRDQVDTFLIEMQKEMKARRERNKNLSLDPGSRAASQDPAIVIFVDDNGKFRQGQDFVVLAAQGYEVGIYVIFIKEPNTPNTCRGRLALRDGGTYQYTETWTSQSRGQNMTGRAELASEKDCEAVARALAGLEVLGSQSNYPLPESIKISQILGDNPLLLDTLTDNWAGRVDDREQVLFPVGVHVGRNGLEITEIDFRPESIGGKGEYHAMLIGTTGSGKSIFLQSLVLATAHRYSPRLINFLFMDFKAGAAELKKISDLPHVVGMITDLSPALADRALKALENELDRRKRIFDSAGKITDVWDYNNRFPQNAMPHLLVVIDEFAEGIKILPDLVERLKELGRQGRAFGMYFLLANQEVNSAVEALKSNVGWYIVLKVKRTEEMMLIDRSLPIAPGKGRGYIRVKSEITSFQGAYSGSPAVLDSVEDTVEFSIEMIGPDGKLKHLYRHSPRRESETGQQSTTSELVMLTLLMKQAAEKLSIQPARAIYLNPIPEHLYLQDLIPACPTYRRFENGRWTQPLDPAAFLTVPAGMLDLPNDCVQVPMQLNFRAGDGSLWIVGMTGSGKTRSLQAILLGLALTHTPQEVQFYILEFGSSGALRALENLPHTGAVIRPNEAERLERLLKYLDEELDRRYNLLPEEKQNLPHLFIVINNFADLREDYSEQADLISHFTRAGNNAGIHLIIATTRSTDIPRNVSSNISRRICLQMATRDEYLDILGQTPDPLTMKVEGRGYYTGEPVAECQVVDAAVSPEPEGSLPHTALALRSAWQGPLPRRIEILKPVIPLDDLLAVSNGRGAQNGSFLAPIGFSFETLELVSTDLAQDIPTCLALGPRQSGKTNFLLAMACGIANLNPGQAEIVFFAPRPGPIARLNRAACAYRILTSVDEMVPEAQALAKRPASGCPRKYVLLIDDLGAVFEPGREALAAALNAVAQNASNYSDVYLFAAGLREEFQVQLGSPLVRLLKQNRAGIAFSKDSSDLDWLGGTISLAQRKRDLPPGRGFYASKGRITLLQTILIAPENLAGEPQASEKGAEETA